MVLLFGDCAPAAEGDEGRASAADRLENALGGEFTRFLLEALCARSATGSRDDA